MEQKNLPYGWKRNKQGGFEYRLLPCDIEDMKKSRRRLLISVLFNIFCVVAMICCFCSHH